MAYGASTTGAALYGDLPFKGLVADAIAEALSASLAAGSTTYTATARADASAGTLTIARGRYDGSAAAYADAYTIAIGAPTQWLRGIMYQVVVIMHRAQALEIVHLEAEVGLNNTPTSAQILYQDTDLRILHRSTEVHIDGGQY